MLIVNFVILLVGSGMLWICSDCCVLLIVVGSICLCGCFVLCVVVVFVSGLLCFDFLISFSLCVIMLCVLWFLIVLI